MARIDSRGVTETRLPEDPEDVFDETDDRFGIGTSTIPGAGKGLFARCALAEGDRLRLIGVLVRADSVADHCTRYADEYKFRMGDCLLIPFGYGGLVNHSLRPNVEVVVEGSSFFLRTLRAVNAGEELFFRYSEYAQDRFGLRSDQS